ncbi:MAG: zf-HC2 domain-containing protein [Calditrichia bacterium]
MEKNERLYHKECRVAEDLLTKRMSEKLTDSEISHVKAHLDSCPQCRAFQDILLKMQETVGIEGKGELSPDPAIRENILRRMKAGRRRKRTNPVDLLRFMKQVLEFRIPVYQAALTVALVIIITNPAQFNGH